MQKRNHGNGCSPFNPICFMPYEECCSITQCAIYDHSDCNHAHRHAEPEYQTFSQPHTPLHTQLLHSPTSHPQSSHCHRPRFQSSHCQWSHAQPQTQLHNHLSHALSSPPQSILAQPSHVQPFHCQSSQVQSILAHSSHAQSPHAHPPHSQLSYCKLSHAQTQTQSHMHLCAPSSQTQLNARLGHTEWSHAYTQTQSQTFLCAFSSQTQLSTRSVHTQKEYCEPRTNRFAGKITKLSDFVGVINNDILFFSKNCENFDPKENDIVTCTASAMPFSSDYPWNATAVQLVRRDYSSRQALILSSQCNGAQRPNLNVGVDRTVRCQQNIDIGTQYKNVTQKRSLNKIASVPVISARQKEHYNSRAHKCTYSSNSVEDCNYSTGVITKVNSMCGLVNNDVLFFCGTLKTKYTPKVGDWVSFEAVKAPSSSQYQWITSYINPLPLPRNDMCTKCSGWKEEVVPHNYCTRKDDHGKDECNSKDSLENLNKEIHRLQKGTSKVNLGMPFELHKTSYSNFRISVQSRSDQDGIVNGDTVQQSANIISSQSVGSSKSKYSKSIESENSKNFKRMKCANSEHKEIPTTDIPTTLSSQPSCCEPKNMAPSSTGDNIKTDDSKHVLEPSNQNNRSEPDISFASAAPSKRNSIKIPINRSKHSTSFAPIALLNRHDISKRGMSFPSIAPSNPDNITKSNNRSKNGTFIESDAGVSKNSNSVKTNKSSPIRDGHGSQSSSGQTSNDIGQRSHLININKIGFPSEERKKIPFSKSMAVKSTTSIKSSEIVSLNDIESVRGMKTLTEITMLPKKKNKQKSRSNWEASVPDAWSFYVEEEEVEPKEEEGAAVKRYILVLEPKWQTEALEQSRTTGRTIKQVPLQY